MKRIKISLGILFNEGAQAQLKADQKVLDEIIKVVESHQFPMPLPSWWVALKERVQ